MTSTTVIEAYEVIVAPTITILEGRINVSIQSGYKLQGGVCVVIDTDGKRTFYQAITGTRMATTYDAL
jgi:hypothetical protein